VPLLPSLPFPVIPLLTQLPVIPLLTQLPVKSTPQKGDESLTEHPSQNLQARPLIRAARPADAAQLAATRARELEALAAAAQRAADDAQAGAAAARTAAGAEEREINARCAPDGSNDSDCPKRLKWLRLNAGDPPALARRCP
jgi:hypothetical protein